LFETLREQIETWRRDNVGPHVFLANIGDVARYMPRVDFARSFFQVAGLELTPVDWWESPDEAAARAVESEAPIVVIVALDETYPEAVPAVARSVKAERPEATVIVAGWPADHVEAFREAGVDEFIHLKCDAFAILAKLAETVGATR
jgi:methylmalonyl-CoA mutase